MQITCPLCGKTKKTRYKNQIFCSRQCSGKYNIRKRKYKIKNTSKPKIDDDIVQNIKSGDKTLCTYVDTIDNGNQKQRRDVHYPQNEDELYNYIDQDKIISRPSIIKIIKNSQKYQEFIEKK